MVRRIEQEHFHVDEPEDLIGRIRIDWNTAVSFFLQPRDHLSIRQIVWQGETIDARGHAIFRGLITELDAFMNHLSSFFLQSAFLFAHFNNRPQFLVAQSLAGAQMQWCEAINNSGANALKCLTYAVEQRHRYLYRECSD